MHSAAGRLYEVDMRLRPNGKGGFLMTGIDAFERYQRQEAWTWEHQALLRARPWQAMPRFARHSRRCGAGCCHRAVHRDTLRTDVKEMRLRMRRELSKAGPGQFDIKQDAGGIADIEFLVQYWVLAAAHAHPDLLTYTDNIRQLEGLAAVGVLDAGDGAMADGRVHRLSHGAASHVARSPGRPGGRSGSLRRHPRPRDGIWRETFEDKR